MNWKEVKAPSGVAVDTLVRERDDWHTLRVATDWVASVNITIRSALKDEVLSYESENDPKEWVPQEVQISEGRRPLMRREDDWVYRKTKLSHSSSARHCSHQIDFHTSASPPDSYVQPKKRTDVHNFNC